MHVFNVLILVAAALAAPVDDRELLFVTFVHRHGDRSPVGAYPNDPHWNESLWNNGWGELTTAGKQSAYALGKWLRERYSDFLPKTYGKRDYEVQSTDFSRTLMSASLVLAGLYEPTGSDVWHPDIHWQPIPVHTTPAALDHVLAARRPCPRHAALMARLMNSEEIRSLLRPFAEDLSRIAEHAGFSSSNVLGNFLASVSVYDSLDVQHQNGLRLPEWSESYYPQPLRDLNSLILRMPTFERPLQRLYCGPLVRDILEHFRSKANGGLRKKMWQYSAHDLTIVSLRQCLGLEVTDSPPYNSALILELSRANGDHHVRVLYKAGDSLRTLVVPGCSEFCPLVKFEELLKPIVPKNWEEECRL